MFASKAIFGAIVLGSAFYPVLADAEPERPIAAVLELFTSQGCSSCPPADELLEHYSQRPDVVALSFSVDYWDYRGWKDTLAVHEFTERQKAYAAVRGDRQVYTPQMVVNGTSHVVGSDGPAIEKAIASSTALPVTMGIGMMGDAIQVSVGAAARNAPRKATVWLVMYERHVEVPVGRGENSSRTLEYYNVVRKLRSIAMWRGEPLKVDVPMGDYRQSQADGCAVLLQEEAADGSPGPMLGAANIGKASW